MIRRVIGILIALGAILVCPYWIYLPVLFVAILIFPFFWEGLLLVWLIEILYGAGIQSLSALLSPLPLSTLVVLLLLVPLREKLRFHV